MSEVQRNFTSAMGAVSMALDAVDGADGGNGGTFTNAEMALYRKIGRLEADFSRALREFAEDTAQHDWDTGTTAKIKAKEAADRARWDSMEKF